MTHIALFNQEDSLGYLERARSGLIREASKFGHPAIDDYLRFKQGNFIVVTGHANVGKTHMILYLMLLHTIKNGTTWLVYSSENEVGSLNRKLLEFKTGLPIKNISDGDFYKELAWVQGHFQFVNTDKLYDIFDLIDVSQEIHKEFKFHGFLVDPYNSLTINQRRLGKISTHEYHYEATSRIRLLCKSLNAMVIVNTHPATEALRRTHAKGHEYEAHPMPPMASDVEGGGKFVNRADEFVVIHRYTQHERDWIFTHIHVRKVKDIETGGRPTSLNDPIRLESIRNNVGFIIGMHNLTAPLKQEQDAPF
jgi:energy-coupling factor transporter ATP-binding protein EcfA2